MRLHLSGMGVLGSLTAWQLHLRGIDFTWDDSEEKINAWGASTGACYPSGGEVDTKCHATWIDWATNGIYPSKVVEVCSYWVDRLTKSLPHGLEADVEKEFKGVRLVGKSVHLDAQRLVTLTRLEFGDRRRKSAALSKPGAVRLVSHGFSKRRARYLWGWTRLVKLKYPPAVSVSGRPSFYLRKNRFQFAYCYPQAGTEWWYAGSNLISQHEARSLKILPKYEAWKARFEELANGAVKVSEEGQMLEGWRPAKAGKLSGTEGYASDGGSFIEREGQAVYYPVMASNGFRHFPQLWEQIETELAIK
jgi:hypothetical protein